MKKSSFLSFLLVVLLALPIVWMLKQKSSPVEAQAANTYLSLESVASKAVEDIHFLDLKNENLRRVPDKLFNYKQLKTLILDGELSVASQAILQDIYTSYNYPSLEDSIQIAQYTQRSKGNQIDFLPNTIQELSLLEHFSIKNNQLKQLPTTINQLQALSYLDVSGNRLEALPEAFGPFPKMEYLNLSNNQLQALDSSMKHMTMLQTLVLSRNQLTEFLSFQNSNFEHLENLELNDNQFEKFPLAILKMASLKSLELSNNQLSSLPDDLSSLRSVEWIDLKGNQFERAEIQRIKKALPSTKVVFE